MTHVILVGNEEDRDGLDFVFVMEPGEFDALEGRFDTEFAWPVNHATPRWPAEGEELASQGTAIAAMAAAGLVEAKPFTRVFGWHPTRQVAFLEWMRRQGHSPARYSLRGAYRPVDQDDG